MTNAEQEAAFERMLDVDPSNAAVRLVYAEWLSDVMGDEVRADGQRWQAKEGTWPQKIKNFWWNKKSEHLNSPPSSCLPDDIYNLLPNVRPMSPVHYRLANRPAAEAALAEALAKLAAKCKTCGGTKSIVRTIMEYRPNLGMCGVGQEWVACPDCAAVSVK